MASTQQLKSRIRSVSSTKQITKAMQMVAASKMRRAQEAQKASAPYTNTANEILSYLASQGATSEHRYFALRPVSKRLIILMAADKGLAGAFNANVFKQYVAALKKDEAQGIKNSTITIGKKASQFASRLKGVEVIASYEDMPDHPSGSELPAVLKTVCDMYGDKTIDAVDLIYTDFQSSISQVAMTTRVLPAGWTETEVSETVRDAKYEPSISKVLDSVAYRLVGAQLFQAFLDSRASEHSMRMLAMKNATDNATDLVDDLTLAMNKARQGAITQELSEISAGVEAMK